MSEIPPPPPPQHQPGFSNYPRSNSSATPYRRPPGVYFDEIGHAWRLVQSNLGTWVLSMLICGVSYYVIVFGIEFLAIFAFRAESFNVSLVVLLYGLFILLGLVGSIVLTGLINMGVKQARSEQIGVGDIFSGFRRSGPIMGGAFIMGLLVCLGYMLLVVPGIYLTGILFFVPMLILDRNMGPIEAINECLRVLKPYAWAIFGIYFISYLLGAVGMMLCLIGALFTMPVFFSTMGLTYNNFFPKLTGQTFSQQIGIEPPR